MSKKLEDKILVLEKTIASIQFSHLKEVENVMGKIERLAESNLVIIGIIEKISDKIGLNND